MERILSYNVKQISNLGREHDEGNDRIYFILGCRGDDTYDADAQYFCGDHYHSPLSDHRI